MCGDERDWDEKLPYIMMAYRTSVHATTGYSPFRLMFGREVNLPIELMYGHPEKDQTTHSEYASKLSSVFQSTYQFVRENCSQQQVRMKQNYDSRSRALDYTEGELVWLYNPHVHQRHCRKFHRPWDGPFKIIKKISDVVFRVQKCGHYRKRLVVHHDRLKPYLGALPREENRGPETGKLADKETQPKEQKAKEPQPLIYYAPYNVPGPGVGDVQAAACNNDDIQGPVAEDGGPMVPAGDAPEPGLEVDNGELQAPLMDNPNPPVLEQQGEDGALHRPVRTRRLPSRLNDYMLE